MSGPGTSSDLHRKARFQEQARGIVSKDRSDRKYGLVVDTAGAIARAMERAYKEGMADAGARPAPPLGPVAADEALDWILVPPRPRQAL